MAEKPLEEATKVERPLSITLVSVFLMIGNLLLAWYLYRGTLLQGRGVGESLYFVLVTVTSFVCGIGFWMMKKWAVYVYAILGVIVQIALLVLGRWNLFSLLLPVVIVYFGYRNLSKMS
jgi:hypothetical protein